MEFEWKAWFMEVWEDNRRLTNIITRALVNAQAIDQTPVPGMRPFREMLLDVYGTEQAYIRGLALDQWEWKPAPEQLRTGPVEDVFEFGRQVRDDTRRLWPSISVESLMQVRPEPFWGGPEGNAVGWLTYALENEIHHRGQAYVYLRLLGQEPPAFYIRNE